MVYTIVAVDEEERSFRGLLCIGAAVPESFIESSKAMQFHDALGPDSDIDGLVAGLKDHLCFILANDARLIEQLKTHGFQTYRCREL